VAQKVTRELVDDLDSSPAVATVRFGYDGRDYEIELSEAQAAELEEFLAPYLEHARWVGEDTGPAAGAGRPAAAAPTRHPDDLAVGLGPRLPGQRTRPHPHRRGHRLPGRPQRSALRSARPFRCEDGCWSASSLASRAGVCIT
jgi:hypothetical protein